MPEVSIKDQIHKMIDLQTIDRQIYDLETELKEKPVLIQELKEAFERQRAHLGSLEERLKRVQLERKDQELTLQGKENELAKAKTQLSQIKTNKEYTAKIGEIEGIKADMAVIEEKILKNYELADEILAEIDKEKEVVQAREKEFLEKRKTIEDEMAVLEDRVKVMKGQRKQKLDGIEASYLQRYERILQHKGGVAIVPVQGHVCGGCFMNVTPQMINAIKMRDRLVECEMCSRILYLEEDA